MELTTKSIPSPLDGAPGEIYNDGGRGVYVPPGLSGPEIVAITRILRDDTDLGLYGAHATAIRILRGVSRLRGASKADRSP